MVTALPELDIDVVELAGFDGVSPKLSQHHPILSVDALVVGVLESSQANFNDCFLEGRDGVVYFFFESA